MTTLTTESATKELGRVDRWFGLTRWGTTKRRELLAGLATALSLSYIFSLNPNIITLSPGPGVPSFQAIAFATTVLTILTTFVMGLVGRIPIALAPGLGINGVIAFTVIPQVGFGGAMLVLVMEGVLVTLLVVTRVREKLFDAIHVLGRKGIAAAIGAFLVLISLADGGIVSGSPVGAALNFQNLVTVPRILFVVVTAVILVLAVLKIRAAIVIGILGGTVAAVIIEATNHLGRFDAVDNPGGWKGNVPFIEDWGALWAPPDWSSFLQINWDGFSGVAPTVIGGLVLALALTDLVDTLGTVTAVGKAAGILDEKTGRPAHLRWILGIDSGAAILGGLFGSSGGTSYIESISGVKSGGRTGLTSIFAAMWMLPALLVVGIWVLVPIEAAAPALFVVGVLMLKDFFTELRYEVVETFEKALADIKADIGNYNAVGVVSSLQGTLTALKVTIVEETPAVFMALVAIVVMPFTFSITNGVGAAFLTYVLLMVVLRRGREVPVLMWIMSFAFAVYFLAPLVASWFPS